MGLWTVNILLFLLKCKFETLMYLLVSMIQSGSETREQMNVGLRFTQKHLKPFSLQLLIFLTLK